MNQLISYIDEKEKRLFNFKVGLFFFRLFSVYWFISKLQIVQSVLERKPIFWIPSQWFGELLFQLGLPFGVFVVLAVSSSATNFLYAINKFSNPIGQCLVFITAMCFNSLEMSTGYLEHTDHLFLLAHFYLLAYKKPTTEFAAYFSLGLLSTYTLAGTFKIITLVYKSLFTNEMTWLHPKSLHYQILFHAELLDKEFPTFIKSIMTLGYFPVALMLFAILMQFAAIFSLRKYWMTSLYLVWILLFHTFNYFALQIEFLYSAITVTCFLFPFYELNQRKSFTKLNRHLKSNFQKWLIR